MRIAETEITANKLQIAISISYWCLWYIGSYHQKFMCTIL